MKIILFLILTISSSIQAETYPTCNVASEKNYELYPNQSITISAVVEGAPCYEAILKIELKNSEKILYSYKAKFKPHVATPWELLTEKDAKNFVNYTVSEKNIISCKELEALENQLFYVTALVPLKEYERYKESSCKAYYHQTHYEAGTSIVIPEGVNNAIPVNEYGV